MTDRVSAPANPKTHLLVVDDDLALGTLLTEFLDGEEFRITIAVSGEDAVNQVARCDFSLVILDVMLPGIDGFTVLRRIREQTDVPVLMLTTRGSAIDRVNGLELGADDYLPKPFQPQELQARIRSILRRARPRTGRMKYVAIGDLELDEKRRLVRCGGIEIDLTGAEFVLLQLLVSKPGSVFPRERLVDRVFERQLTVYDRSIDSLVSNLRKKLGPAHAGGDRIKSVRGVGYAYVSQDPKAVSQ